jgi:hypothetical protein
MATILTIFFQILLNFELKLEISNIMLVCKFEINWSTNKNLGALTTYLGRKDACHFHIPCSALRGQGTKINIELQTTGFVSFFFFF